VATKQHEPQDWKHGENPGRLEEEEPVKVVRNGEGGSETGGYPGSEAAAATSMRATLRDETVEGRSLETRTNTR